MRSDLRSKTFQRRDRSVGEQECSCRMGSHVDRAMVSSGRLISGHPYFWLCEVNQTHDGNGSDPNSLILLDLSGSIGRQSAYLIKVSNHLRQEPNEWLQPSVDQLTKKPWHRGGPSIDIDRPGCCWCTVLDFASACRRRRREDRGRRRIRRPSPRASSRRPRRLRGRKRRSCHSAFQQLVAEVAHQ